MGLLENCEGPVDFRAERGILAGEPSSDGSAAFNFGVAARLRGPEDIEVPYAADST